VLFQTLVQDLLYFFRKGPRHSRPSLVLSVFFFGAEWKFECSALVYSFRQRCPSLIILFLGEGARPSIHSSWT